MTELVSDIETLIKKARNDSNALYALQYSQAALNAAHALQVLATTPVRS